MQSHRYFSQMAIPGIGMEGQQRIATAKVLVIGAGGLGCPVLSYLAGAGIGTIGVVDHDTVELKNLHRQVLYQEADLQQPKAIAARKKLSAHNSTITVYAYPERLTAVNAVPLIDRYDIVVDCCDNMETRYIIDTVTRQQHKPFVYGAVRQWEGQVSVFNYRQGPCFSDLFPDPAVFAHEPDCGTAGIIGHAAGIIGCIEANEVIKIILQTGTVLSGKVLAIDLSAMSFNTFTIKHFITG